MGICVYEVAVSLCLCRHKFPPMLLVHINNIFLYFYGCTLLLYQIKILLWGIVWGVGGDSISRIFFAVHRGHKF